MSISFFKFGIIVWGKSKKRGIQLGLRMDYWDEMVAEYKKMGEK